MIYNKKGYTYIELLIVIATMTLLFSLSYANFRDFQRRRLVEEGVQTIVADLRSAQEKALSGVRQSPPCNGDFLGYNFNPHNQQYRYQIFEDCSTNDKEDDDVILTNEIRFVTVPDNTTILFNTVTGGTDITAGSTIAIIVGYAGHLSGGDKKVPGNWLNTVTITISSSGDIVY